MRTQSVEAVVEFLKYIEQPSSPLPESVYLPGMVLVLSNRKDCYYIVNAKSCSCPSAAYRPGQRCKHQRKHFPLADRPAPMAPVESLLPPGKWPGGFNGPVDPESIIARASSEKGA